MWLDTNSLLRTAGTPQELGVSLANSLQWHAKIVKLAKITPG